MRKLRRWSLARLDLLRAGYTTRPDPDGLRAEINALPGPEISRMGMNAKAFTLGLKRPPELLRTIIAAGGTKGNALRRSKGGAHIKRTPERIALVTAEWATCTDRAALLARVNALPGPALTGLKALRAMGRALGLKAPAATVQAAKAAGGRRGRAKQMTAARAGRPVRTTVAAWDVSVPRREFAEVPPPEPAELTAEQQAAMADAAMERRLERARDMLRRKKDAGMIAANTRLPLREVFRLAGEMRRG